MDGARHDVLHDLLERGELPNLARWVIEPGGITVATTVFPSTTGVAYIPFLFGRYPGTANVPGIRWLDRGAAARGSGRSEEHTSELQSRFDLVCRLLLEKKKKNTEVVISVDIPYHIS